MRVIDTRKRIKYETYNDHFENAKRYNVPRAQLIIADIPYSIGENAYASNPAWYANWAILEGGEYESIFSNSDERQADWRNKAKNFGIRSKL